MKGSSFSNKLDGTEYTPFCTWLIFIFTFSPSSAFSEEALFMCPMVNDSVCWMRSLRTESSFSLLSFSSMRLQLTLRRDSFQKLMRSVVILSSLMVLSFSPNSCPFLLRLCEMETYASLILTFSLCRELSSLSQVSIILAIYRCCFSVRRSRLSIFLRQLSMVWPFAALAFKFLYFCYASFLSFSSSLILRLYCWMSSLTASPCWSLMEVDRPMQRYTFCFSSNTSKSICRLRSSLHSFTSLSMLRVACSSCPSSWTTCFSVTVSVSLALQALSSQFSRRKASSSFPSASSSSSCFCRRVRLCWHSSCRYSFSRARALYFSSSISSCSWNCASACLTRWSVSWELRCVASNFSSRDLQQSSSCSQCELSYMYFASRMLLSSSSSRFACCSVFTCPCSTITSCWLSPSRSLSSRLISMSLLICLSAFSQRP